MSRVVSDSPSWLRHLPADWREWRTDQKLKGRDPDPYIKEQLRKAGKLTAEEAEEEGL